MHLAIQLTLGKGWKRCWIKIGQMKKADYDELKVKCYKKRILLLSLCLCFRLVVCFTGLQLICVNVNTKLFPKQTCVSNRPSLTGVYTC